VSLALKSKAERYKKHQRDGEVFQTTSHSYFLGERYLLGQVYFE
jgi:hypothetical protein